MNTDQNVDERWLPVSGYEGLYEVSNLGGVRSVKRRRCAGTTLRPAPNSHGYLSVVLHDGQGGRRTSYVHVLVAQAFIGPRPTGMDVRHGPGGKLDNRPGNLSYGTRQQNHDDQLRDGTRVRGEDRWNARLTEAAVRQCRTRWATGESQSALAREFGVSWSAMNYAIRGINWKHVAVGA